MLQNGLDDVDGRAARLQEVGLALVDPPTELDDDVGIPHFQHHGGRGRSVEQEGQRTHGLQPGGGGVDRVVLGVHPQLESEAALGVEGVVEDGALEDVGIGQAQVVAVQRHQHGGARRQPHDDTLVGIDDHVVVGAKRLAQAQHDAGDVVLDRVLQRKADGQTDQPGAACRCSEQGHGVENAQRQQQAQQNADDPDGLSDEVRHERVGRDHAPEPLRRREQVSCQRDGKEGQQGRDIERPCVGYGIDDTARPVENRVEIVLHAQRAGDGILYRNDAFDPAGEIGGALGRAVVGSRATKRHHALRGGDGHVLQRFDLAEHGAQPVGDLLVHLSGRLDGDRCGRRGIGSAFLRERRSLYQGHERDEQQDGEGPRLHGRGVRSGRRIVPPVGTATIGHTAWH